MATPGSLMHEGKYRGLAEIYREAGKIVVDF